MNSNKENTHCNESGNIFNLLNNSQQDFLYQGTIIILITLFYILKITELCEEFREYIMP
jgi:hypothetical protein